MSSFRDNTSSFSGVALRLLCFYPFLHPVALQASIHLLHGYSFSMIVKIYLIYISLKSKGPFCL